MKREHAKYTSARITAELEKAHSEFKAELKAERERSATEATELRAELAQLKLKKVITVLYRHQQQQQQQQHHPRHKNGASGQVLGGRRAVRTWP